MEFRQAFDPARALKCALKLVPHAWVTLLLGGILISFLDSGGPTSWRADFELEDLESWPVILPALPFLAGFGCLGILCWLVACRMQIGYAGAVQRVMVTGEDEFTDLWHDRGLWGSMILARLLKYLVVSFGALPGVAMFLLPVLVMKVFGGPEELGVALGIVCVSLFVPFWIYLLLGMALVEQVVAIEQRPPLEAVRRSWEVARGNRAPLLIFSIAMWLFSFAGVCLCLVGVYLTATCANAAWYEAYLRFATKPPAGGMWVDGEREEGSEGEGAAGDWALGGESKTGPGSGDAPDSSTGEDPRDLA